MEQMDKPTAEKLLSDREIQIIKLIPRKKTTRKLPMNYLLVNALWKPIGKIFSERQIQKILLD